MKNGITLPAVPSEHVERLRVFYKHFFNKNITPVIINPPKGQKIISFVVPPSFSEDGVLSVLRQHISLSLEWGEIDLQDVGDTGVQNYRSVENGSIILIKNKRIPDKDPKRKKTCMGVTLLEELLIQFFFFWVQRGKLVDGPKVLCTGSSVDEEYIPTVQIFNQTLWIDFEHEAFIDDLRGRPIFEVIR